MARLLKEFSDADVQREARYLLSLVSSDILTAVGPSFVSAQDLATKMDYANTAIHLTMSERQARLVRWALLRQTQSM